MSASRSRRCSRPTPMWRRMQPILSLSRSRNCRSCSTRARRRASSRTAARPSRRSWKNRTAMLRRLFATPMPWLSSISRSGAIPAFRWKRAARSRATTPARDVLELHGAAKVPHWNRDSIARMLGRDPSTVHLYEGHVGGGFGIRGELYPEDVLVCLAALRLGRPVKWIEDRREHLIAANHSRAATPQGARRSRCATAAFSQSRTNSSTTRAAMCAPMQRPCPTSRRRCCRGPIACRPIARSAIFGSPTRRRAAPIARPAGSRARSCASG